jgi:hypothetical protein
MAKVGNRVNLVGIICGGRGTGKSTFVEGDKTVKVPGIIPTYLKRKPSQKILIVDTFDNPFWRHYPVIQAKDLARWKKGIYRMFSSDVNRMMQEIEANCFNTVIFFEDSTKFIGSRLTDDQKKFIIDSKQKNLDIFFIFHYLIAVPNDLIRVSDYMVLFKTNDTWNSNYERKYPMPGLCDMFDRVKKHQSKYYNETIRVSD